MFAPKYRRKVFFGEKREVSGKIQRQLCEWKGVEIHEAEICPDHVHMLVSAPPKLSVTNIMRWLKGITAYQLFRQCPELQTSYWKQQGRHLWSPSYYVESIGAVNEQAVAKYIDDQRRKEVNLE